MESYSRSITVSRSPKEVFSVICLEMSGWWAAMTGPFEKVGDEAGICFEGDHIMWRFRALSLIPEKYVELECTEAHHDYEGSTKTNCEEWKGTRLVFEIVPEEKKTRIIFIHQGLTPKLDCYSVCEAGWDHFFVNCLKRYLENPIRVKN